MIDQTGHSVSARILSRLLLVAITAFVGTGLATRQAHTSASIKLAMPEVPRNALSHGERR
jgi:hypothetical protein